jgi:hypothetical protein
MIADSLGAQGMDQSESPIGRLPRVLAGLLMSVLLSACGGGGGGGGSAPPTPPPPPPQTATISGNVAAWAALTGTVSVYDSSSHSQPVVASTAIGPGGQYSVAVTGLTAPFLLQATGQLGGQGPTVTLYSVATAAGTVNITPVTSLMALNMAGGNIQSLMTGSTGSLPSLTVADLSAQNASMDTMLSAVLTQDGQSANYNFYATSFTVGGAGYSQLLNAVTIDITNPAAVTITDNATPATPITINTQAGTPSGPLDVVSGPSTLPVGVTVGGSITGLTASGLQLQNNGADTLSLAANTTSFTFATEIASGAAYAVTVKTQPSGQSCAVTNGTGTAGSSSVTNVSVACTAVSTATSYTVGGSITNLEGVTLTLLLESNGGSSAGMATVLPGQATFSFGSGLSAGATYNVTVQQQPSGQSCSVANGAGIMSASNVSSVSVSCVTASQWAWITGDDTSLAAVYGTQGQAAVGNTPGGRGQSATSVDTSGNLWLFGGASAGNALTNDLWFYSKSTGEWTWVGGSSSPGAAGIYGTQGVSASANIPGARFGAVSWTDSAGNFWLLGGQGYDSAGTQSWLNDLWEYSSATGQWVWVSGSSVGNSAGVYGTAGVAAANNQPGGRYYAVGWIDAGNHLWLYGGAGIDVNGKQNTLNDLWEFDAGTGLWTWINGSPSGYVTGVYGTQGVAAGANAPGSRQQATGWTDSAGGLWLFGGYGLDSAGTYDALNDLWRYNAASGLWTWMGGSTIVDARGVYGLQGAAAAANSAGARYGATSWVDVNGAFWLLGGEGYDSTTGISNIQNDVWKYDPASGQWAWMGGGSADGGGDPGVYLVQGLPGAGNSPGARTSSISWTDASGVWLYGGNASSPAEPGSSSYTISLEGNDLWRFGPAIFYNGTGSMAGTFTDQNGCQYSAPATIVNANVTMSTQSAGAVTITYAVPSFTKLAATAPTCPNYGAYSGSFSVPVLVNGGFMEGLAGSIGSVNATISGGVVSGTVGFQETGAEGSGTFSWTESGSFGTVAVPETVPSLVGLTEAAATTAITAAGLQVGTITHQSSATVPPGIVITEIPAAGVAVPTGSAVNLVVSSGGAPLAIVSAPASVSGYAPVLLNGTRSVDPTTTIQSYAWTQIAGPPVTLTNWNTALASFIAPQVSALTAFSFILTVTDSTGNTSSQIDTVNVVPASTANLIVAIVDATFLVAITPNPHTSYTIADGPPLAGSTSEVEVTMSGALQSTTFAIEDASGNVLSNPTLQSVGNPSFGPRRFVGSINVPTVPFRFAASGTTADGQTYSVQLATPYSPMAMSIGFAPSEIALVPGTSGNCGLIIYNGGPSATFTIVYNDPSGVLTGSPSTSVDVAAASSVTVPIAVTYPMSGGSIGPTVTATASVAGDTSRSGTATLTLWQGVAQ